MATQSLQEHMTAVRDELQAAAKQSEPEMRARIDAAKQHAETAASQLKSQAGSSETMQHLNEIAKDAQKSLDEDGAALQARMNTMMAHAKSAIDASKKS